MRPPHPIDSIWISTIHAYDALFGFKLPQLPRRSINLDTQLHLLTAHWRDNAVALDVRFIRSRSTPDIGVTVLCRVHCPPHIAASQFHAYCRSVAARIQRLWSDCGYILQPLQEEVTLMGARVPFPLQAIAEIRRDEGVLLLSDTYTRYETYITDPWEWDCQGPLQLYSSLLDQEDDCLISVYLEPTRLSTDEERLLNHVTSLQVRDVLLSGGIEGEATHDLYTTFLQRLQMPYLLRITLAAPTASAMTHLKTTILDQSRFNSLLPAIKSPQDDSQWQAARRNLCNLEWVGWGNLRDGEPSTARLRYLTDTQGATMAFDLPVAPEPATSATQKIKVLLIFANPLTLKPLYLGAEDRIIHEAIQLSPYRHNVDITVRHAATIHDLRRSLLRESFHIVHIAGHAASKGLLLEDADKEGGAYLVPQKELADIFHAYKKILRCVILNACYSINQGESISLGIPFTIAMEGPLGDKAAREFARGFYDAIGAGKEIDFAYGEGCRTARVAASNSVFQAKLFSKDSSS